MQLDRSILKRVEGNGMVVALTCVYKLDTDQIVYEVSKTLTGSVLVSKEHDEHAEANAQFLELATEIGAYNDAIALDIE